MHNWLVLMKGATAFSNVQCNVAVDGKVMKWKTMKLYANESPFLD